jgi:hypothetical protein
MRDSGSVGHLCDREQISTRIGGQSQAKAAVPNIEIAKKDLVRGQRRKNAQNCGEEKQLHVGLLGTQEGACLL